MEDECYSTYLERLAHENGFISGNELRKYTVSYLSKTKRHYYSPSKTSVLRNEISLPGISRQQDEILEYLIHHFPYPSYAPFMTHGKQALYINSLFSTTIDSRRHLITQYKSLTLELRYCLECFKEDKERVGMGIYRVKHQLPGVCICSKHKKSLRVLDTIFIDPYDQPEEHSKEIKCNTPLNVLLEYNAAIEQLQDTYLSTTTKLILQTLNNRLSVLYPYAKKKGFIDAMAFNNAFSKSRYFPLCVGETRFRFGKSISDKMIPNCIAMILFAYGNMDNFIKEIKENKQKDIKEIEKLGYRVSDPYHCSLLLATCKTCGTSFIATLQGLRDGFGCPQCQSKWSTQEMENHTFCCGSGGEVQCVYFNEKKKKFEIRRNETTLCIDSRSYFYLENRDLDDRKKRILEHSNKDLGDFKLLELNNDIALLQHKSCGRTFTNRSFYTFKYIDNKTCPHCEYDKKTHIYTEGECKQALHDIPEFKFVELKNNELKVFHTSCQFEFIVPSIYKFLKNPRCSICVVHRKDPNKRNHFITTEEFMKERMKLYPGYKFIKKEKNKITLQHQTCGGVFTVISFSQFKKSPFCRVCKEGAKPNLTKFKKGGPFYPHKKSETSFNRRVEKITHYPGFEYKGKTPEGCCFKHIDCGGEFTLDRFGSFTKYPYCRCCGVGTTNPAWEKNAGRCCYGTKTGEK